MDRSISRSLVLAKISFAFLILSNSVRSLCDCGYRLDNGDRYTHRIHNNFTKFQDTADEQSLIAALRDWYTMGWRIEGEPEYHTIPRQNERSNIWIKEGVLHMRQKGHNKGSAEPVSVAEINTKQSDILYGSFRIQHKIILQPGAEGGSIAGFFVYYNDTQESDIEVITAGNKGSVLQYTNHPAYNPQTNTMIPGASYRHQSDGQITGFQEQRLDWKPDATKYYQNDRLIQEIRMNVPSHPAKIMVNIWANNGSWSGPPSTKDVIMGIRDIKLYFNTTESNIGMDAKFNAACKHAGGPLNEEAICSPGEAEGSAGLSKRADGLIVWIVAAVVACFVVF